MPRATHVAGLIATLAIAAACNGSSGERDDRTTDAIVGLVDRGATRASCAGALIAPDVVLTAAHCVVEVEPRIDPPLDVFTAAELEIDTSRTAVREVVLHPAFEQQFLKNDLAVLVLAEPIEAAPFPVWRSGMNCQLVGQPARFFGFATRGIARRQRRRAGAVSIEAEQATKLTLAPAPDVPCASDSGGPLLVRCEGVEYLAGVVSSSDRQCREFGRAIRLDAYRDGFLDRY